MREDSNIWERKLLWIKMGLLAFCALFFLLFQKAHPTTSYYFSFRQTMWEINMNYGKDNTSIFASICWGISET